MAGKQDGLGVRGILVGYLLVGYTHTYFDTYLVLFKGNLEHIVYPIVTYYLIKIIATSIFTFDNRGYVVRNKG